MRAESPSIETPRLRLRRHRPDDFPACHALWSDPDVTRYIGGQPSTTEGTWARLLRYVGHWGLFGFGFWLVEEKASGRFVGEAGLAVLRRDIEPGFGDTPEAGWVLAPWAQGRGYATEAVCAALAEHEARFGPTRTVCVIDPPNTASVRVAERCGYREVRATVYKGDPILVFERPGSAP